MVEKLAFRDSDLKRGKHIMITGCSSGLGRALMDNGIQRGHIIFPHMRRGKCRITGDITDPQFIDRFYDWLQQCNTQVFINNAAIYWNVNAEVTSDDKVREIIDTNVTAQILLLKRAYNYFRRSKGGLIININSLSVDHPNIDESIYCASKYALMGFSKSLQAGSVGTGVEIVDVYPGGIQTRMTEDRDNYDTLMDVDEVANQVLDLVNRKHHYVNEIKLRKRNK